MRALLSFLFSSTGVAVWACDVCQKNQPAPLRGITHGTGPQGQWDLAIVWGAGIIVTVTLVLALRMLLRPGEGHAGHIKRIILHDPSIPHGT